MPSSRSQKRKLVRNQESSDEGRRSAKALEELSSNDVAKNPADVPVRKSRTKSEEMNERVFQLFIGPEIRSNKGENAGLSLRIEHPQNGKESSRSEVLRSGDFVLVMGPTNSINYVAKIRRFYQNQFTEEIHATVQWFFSKDEVPSRILPPDMHDNELLIDITKAADSIDVESILDKCMVNWMVPNGSVKKHFCKNEFFYRRSYDGRKVEEVSSLQSDNSQKLSKAEQRNSMLSSKRISKTPSKFIECDEEAPPTRNSSKKVKQRKSAKIVQLLSSNDEQKMNNGEKRQTNRTLDHHTVKNSSKQKPVKKVASRHSDTSSKRSQSRIESKLLTSPVAASGYGKLDASIVALNILNSDESDDFDDDCLSLSSKSSMSSDLHLSEKPAPRSAIKKPTSKQKTIDQKTKSGELKNTEQTAETGKKKTGQKIEVSYKKNRDQMAQMRNKKKKQMSLNSNSNPTSRHLVISIPKAQLQHNAVSDLKSKAFSEEIRSSPRRKSAIRIVKETSSSGDSDENSSRIGEEDDSSGSESDATEYQSSSDESFEEPSYTPKQRASRSRTPKSAKRVRVDDKETSVTPILIKLPRNKLPFIPARPTPVRSAKGKLEKSRKKLHVSAVPECLPCREKEFQEIFTFVEGKIRSGGGGCMYVSGVPGTGKTATVTEVMNSLRLSVEEGDLNEFTYININGMRLTEPRQAYVQLLLQLTKQKATPDHAANLLTKLFSQRRKTSTVVVADELDLLWTKKQDVLYHLFDWPTHRHARLIVVAIANTMDLPERILMNRVASRLGLTRLTFSPYTFKQLQEIIMSRLNGLDTFESDAVQLASRKVAAVSGDARRCLDICRRATEIAERANNKIVGIEHVHSALQEMFAAPMMRAISSCSKQEKLFLQAIIAEFRRSGMEEATLGRIIEQHTTISQLEGAAPVSVTTLVKISQHLASSRLILLEGGHRDLFSRIRLNVSVDDVLFSLKQ